MIHHKLDSHGIAQHPGYFELIDGRIGVLDEKRPQCLECVGFDEMDVRRCDAALHAGVTVHVQVLAEIVVQL